METLKPSKVLVEKVPFDGASRSIGEFLGLDKIFKTKVDSPQNG